MVNISETNSEYMAKLAILNEHMWCLHFQAPFQHLATMTFLVNRV